jgi:hypothetical protein
MRLLPKLFGCHEETNTRRKEVSNKRKKTERAEGASKKP